MKISELIEHLEDALCQLGNKELDDVQVITSKDPEGNGFWSIDDISFEPGENIDGEDDQYLIIWPGVRIDY